MNTGSGLHETGILPNPPKKIKLEDIKTQEDFFMFISSMATNNCDTDQLIYVLIQVVGSLLPKEEK